MTGHRGLLGTLSGLPKADRAILGSRGQPLTTGGPRGGHHLVAVSLQTAHGNATVHVPEDDAPVGRRRSEHRALGRPGDRIHNPDVPVEPLHKRAIRGIPDAHQPVLAGSSDPAPIRRPGYTPNNAGMPEELLVEAPRLHIPALSPANSTKDELLSIWRVREREDTASSVDAAWLPGRFGGAHARDQSGEQS